MAQTMISTTSKVLTYSGFAISLFGLFLIVTGPVRDNSFARSFDGMMSQSDEMGSHSTSDPEARARLDRFSKFTKSLRPLGMAQPYVEGGLALTIGLLLIYFGRRTRGGPEASQRF